MKSFIFQIWLSVGKTLLDTVAGVESIAVKQYSVIEKGGRQMISSSANGKSFTYATDQSVKSSIVAEMAHEAWIILQNFTDDEDLKDWLCEGVKSSSGFDFSEVSR